MKLKSVSVLGLATMLGAGAINHVRNPKFYYAVVPPSLCTDKSGEFGLLTRHQWVLASAVPEVLGAVGPDGTPQAKRVHLLRLPLQIPLVAWAWSVRRA